MAAPANNVLNLMLTKKVYCLKIKIVYRSKVQRVQEKSDKDGGRERDRREQKENKTGPWQERAVDRERG